MGAVGAGVALVWWLTRRGPAASFPTAPVAAVMGAWGVGLLLLTHAYFPAPNSRDWNMPARVAGYGPQLATARGDVMMIGSPQAYALRHPTVVEDFLVGSSWLVTGRPVQNLYTTIGFRAFNQRYCYSFNGGTCGRALDTVLSTEPTTGARRVDLLAVSTLLLRKADVPAARRAQPPPGWRVARETTRAVTWVRDRPVEGAGGVVWASPGTAVTTLGRDDRTVRLRVGEVPRGGGTVVLSRLAWPGYRTSEGRLAGPVDGYLLALRLDPEDAGKEVRLRFDPPGWRVATGAWVLALLLSAGLVAEPLVRARRRGDRSRAAPEAPAR
jgi:hypothetical protein